MMTGAEGLGPPLLAFLVFCAWAAWRARREPLPPPKPSDDWWDNP